MNSWYVRCSLFFVGLLGLGACGGDDNATDPPAVQPPSTNNPPVVTAPGAIGVSGRGAIGSRFTAEVWIHGNYGYTTTWGTRNVGGVGTPGNMVFIWDIRPAAPVLLDSLLVPGAGTVGDVQVSADGRYLVVPTEPGPGSLVTYDLTDPVKPRQLSVFTSSKISSGVHTAEIQTIGGRLTAFLSVNGGSAHPPRLMIVDLGDPTQPREIVTRDIARSFIHDVFVRDGFLLTGEWNNGMGVFDIGGGGRGGTLQAPVEISRVGTVGGRAHNIWWFRDPNAGNAKRYAFVGEEGPASLFSSSSGDIHVIDMDATPVAREVAVLNVTGAGTHNFSVDEPNGFLYAAYYNGGVQALDIRGDLGTCAANQKTADGRCDLRLMGRVRAIGLLDQSMPVFIWGVHFTGGSLYASDMPNGLWKLRPLTR